jgi:predicted metal-binding membrane protein
MTETTPHIESLLRRDRAIVISGVVAVVAIAWGYTIYVAQSNADMGASMGMAMGNVRSWSGVDFSLMFVMWVVMMVAMMVPSAAPMVLMFATVNRRRREQSRPFVATSVFLSGYVVVWTGFALAATLGNWGLHQASLLTSMMGGSSSGYLGGGLLLAAGVFQWSQLKYICLTHCRSPLSFLMSGWREGTGGAFKMGLQHGRYCLGCCWVLMALLFVLGVMNLVWIAALAAFVLAEKVIPAGDKVSKLTGALLMAWGVGAVLAAAF